MTEKELEQIILSVLTDYIADQVATRLNEEKKQGVVLFTGSLAGFGGVPEMLDTMERRGWKLKAVLSKGAETVLPLEKLRQSLSEDSITTAEDEIEVRRLMDERPFLLLPTLTVNTAAKIACCIADEPVSNAAAYGIGKGKRILACVDGCCPDRKALQPGGFHAPEAYREQMRNNLTALRRCGIGLTDIRSLPDEAERQFIKLIQGEKETASTSRAVTDLRRTRVVGRGDVLSCHPGGRLLVDREAVVTQTAAEELQRRRIELVKG